MFKLIDMKKYFVEAVIIVACLLSGCQKGLLNQTPKVQLTTASALVTYNNFQTYAWKLYDYFSGYGNSYSGSGADYMLSQE